MNFQETEANVDGFVFVYKMGRHKVIHSSSDVCCTDIVDGFARFMMGCGFAPSNVLEAMADVTDQLTGAWGPCNPLPAQIDSTPSVGSYRVDDGLSDGLLAQ